jgi:C4-dicarboxylate-specific signal transduction histidine kinase
MKQASARILCVDDGPLNLSLLEAMLSPRGYDVVTAVNGSEALERIKTERIDICLLDVMMPVMDGFEVCRRIKSDPNYRNIPVVMITSYADTEYRIRGTEAGAEDFITKPFDSDEVLARIKMLLHVKSLNDRLQSAYHDIADLNNSLEERIAQAVEEIRRKDQMLIVQGRLAAMGEMIDNIAHQWRQPLNSLGLIIQQVPFFHETGELTGEFLKKNTGKSMELIQHMSRTIDDFKNFFKPDKQAVSFSVNKMVERALSLTDASFKDRKISTALHTEGDPMATGYPNEYGQVLLNIFMNAADALAANQVDDALISIRSFAEAGASVVTVSDNAGGIAEEIIDRLFDPYFTTKGPDQGTGIGLFMSKMIIEKNMGGKLTVRNTGAGAEFRIETSGDFRE